MLLAMERMVLLLLLLLLVVLLAMLLAISSPAKAGGISRRLINTVSTALYHLSRRLRLLHETQKLCKVDPQAIQDFGNLQLIVLRLWISWVKRPF